MTEMMRGHVAQRDGHITLFGKHASRFKPHEATEGLAPLIVDRDFRRVLAHANQALVLQKGQVVLRGTADAVAGAAALSNYLGV